MYFKFAASGGHFSWIRNEKSCQTGFVVEGVYLPKYGLIAGLLTYCMDTFQLNFDLNPEVQKV